MGWIIARHRNHPNGDIICRHVDEPDTAKRFMRDFIIHGRTTEILGYADSELDSWNAMVGETKARRKHYD